MRLIASFTFFLLFFKCITSSGQVLNNIGVSAIDSPLTTFCGTNLNLYARVSNAGNNQIDSFVVNWSVNGVVQPAVTQVQLIDTVGGSASSNVSVFIGTLALVPGEPTEIKVWTSLPNGMSDSIPDNDSLVVYRTATSMSGTYTVDPAGNGSLNFTTLDSAISKLQTFGICGPVLINIAPGIYTRTNTLKIGNISGASNMNTLTVKGSGNGTCKIAGSLDSAAIISINQSKYITLRDLEVSNTSLKTPVAISVLGNTNKISVVGCKLQVSTPNNLTSKGGYGLLFTGTLTGIDLTACQSDSSLVDSNQITGGFHALVFTGASNVAANRNLVIRNNTLLNMTKQGAYLITIYNAVTVKDNRIVFNSIDALWSSTGIQFSNNINSGTQAHLISNNQVIGFNGYGILCTNIASSSTIPPMLICNNVLVGKKTVQSTGMCGLRISLTAGLPVQVYHNTVVVNANYEIGQNQAAFYGSGSSLFDIRNNIFIVKSGTTTTPLRLGSNPTTGKLNNNLYYNAASSNLIQKAGVYYDAATYKTSANGGDSSFNMMPGFVNPDLDDYKLRHGCIKGTNLSGIVSTDITGKSRSTTPLIGAYEFAGDSIDISILDILTSAIPNQGLQDFNVRVINSGSNPVSTYKVSYTRNNGPVVSQVKMISLQSCAIDTMVFKDSNAIVLSDSQYVKVWVDTISSGYAEKESDTLSLKLLSGFKGLYTVGGNNPDFSTPQEAIARLETRGLIGHVTLDIRPGTYSGYLRIGALPGLHDTATLTIDGHNADSVTITTSIASGGVVFLDQTGYINIRNISVSNTWTGSNTYGIWVSSNTAAISKISISGCKISVVQATSGKYALLVSGLNAASASLCDSLVVDSNYISGGISGLLFKGGLSILNNKGIVISRNMFQNVSTGIEVNNIYNPVIITGNTIKSANNGIVFVTNKSWDSIQPHRIVNNRILYFSQYGLQYTSSGASTSARAIIANNEIVSLGGVSTVISGITLSTEVDEKVGVYHNTVMMRGTSTSTGRAAVSYYGSLTGEIKNNILVVSRGSYYPVYMGSSLNNNLINNNLYYNSSNSTLVFRNNIAYTGLNYRTASVGGDSSMNLFPMFTSADSATLDLRIVSKCTRYGVNIPEVNTDLMGVYRTQPVALGAYEPSSPGKSLSILNISEPLFAPTLYRGLYTLKLVVCNEGVTNLSQYSATYSNNNALPVTLLHSTSLAPCQLDTFEFSGLNSLQVLANNRIKAYVSLPDTSDSYRDDDTLTKVFYPTMKGSYTIGSDSSNDFFSISQAMNALASRGVAGAVNFIVQPGTYTGAVEIGGTIPGLSKEWNITFDGQYRDSVRFVADTNGAVILVNKIKYVRLKNLSVENKQSSYGIAIAGVNNSTMLGTGCEISNCRVKLPVLSGTATTGTGISINGSVNGIGTGKTLIDSIRIDSNIITGGANGIAFYGAEVNPSNREVLLRNNMIDSCNAQGISVNGIYSPVSIVGNTINMNGASANGYGIRLIYCRAANGIHNITRNQVYNFGYSGIYCSYATGSSAADLHITNNILVSADSSMGVGVGAIGIYLYLEATNYQTKISNNTVIMRGNYNVNMPTGFFNHGTAIVDVVNNIFAVYSTRYTPVYLYSNTSGTVQSNVYYVANATASSNLIYRSGYLTRDDYLNAAGGGLLSNNGEPLFESLYQTKPSLKLLRGCMVQTSLGSYIPQVDVFGKARLQQYTTVGAIEDIKANLTIMSMIPFSAPVTAGPQDLRFIVQNRSTDTIFSYTAGYQQNSYTQNQVKSTLLKSCELDTVTFSGAQSPSLVARNDFSLYVGLVNDSVSLVNDDTLKVDVRTVLSGMYTVGDSTADFMNVKSAVAALKSGIAGSVTFVVKPGVYSGFLDIRGPIVGADTTRRITFTSNDSANTIVESDTTIATIAIRNIPNIHIDRLGIKGKGGAIVVNDQTAYAKTSIIRVSNCVINSNGTSLSFGGTLNYDSLVIDSNTIANSTIGILVDGKKSLLLNRATFVNANFLSNIRERGIQVKNIFNHINVIGNTVNMQDYQYGNTGIYVEYNTDGTTTNATHTVRVSNNRVDRFSIYGIYVGATGNYVRGNLIVTNNSVVSAEDAYSSTDHFGIKIWLYGYNSFATVQHNSVAMQGGGTSTSCAALYMEGSNYNIRNNIFAVYNGGAVPLRYSSSPNTGSSITNYNLFYNNSPSVPHVIIKLPGGTVDSSFYKYYGGDSSFMMEPPFVNRTYFPANLALTDYCTMNKGVNIGGVVSTDIDQVVRATQPSVGAFEHRPLTSNVSIKQILTPLSSDTLLTCGMNTVKYLVLNAGTDTVNQYTAQFSINNGTVYSQLRNVSLPSCAIDTVTFSPAYLGVKNELLCYTSLPNGIADAEPRADSSRQLLNPRLSGEFIIGQAPSDFLTITEAIQRLNKGVGGAVVFKIKTGNYKEFLTFLGVKGSSSTNTITFTSYAGNRDSVRIYTTYLGFGYVETGMVSFNSTAQYYILDKLTLDADGATDDYTLEFNGAASYDTIRNCIIRRPYSTSTNRVNVFGRALTGTGIYLENNQLSGGYLNISLSGSSRIRPMKNLTLRGNDFLNSNSIIDYCRACEMSGNTMSIPSTALDYWTRLNHLDSGFHLISNTFNSYTGKPATVIINNTRNDSLNKMIVANNQFPGNQNAALSLYDTCVFVDVVHNTLSGTGATLSLGMGNGSAGIRVLNNIVTGSISKIEFNTTALPFLTSDYNAATSYIVSSTTFTPPQFKSTYAPKEANSVTVSAGLTSTSNLKPDSLLPASWAVNGKGIHIGYSINDKNNQPRPQTLVEGAPDIGAYEFTPVSIPQNLTLSTINTTSRAFLLGSDTMAKIKWTGPTITSLTGRLYSGAYPPDINGSTHKSLNEYWVFSGTVGSSVFDLSLYYRQPLLGSITSVSDLIGARKPNSNPWSFYQGSSIELDTVRKILTIKGLSDFGLFTGTDVFVPLPVELLEFTGLELNGGALLQWKTATEKQTSHFEVHASYDGTNYEKIGNKIKAKGNSNVLMSYQYDDEHAFIRNTRRYYKLRMVDIDGNFSWSNTITVAVKDQPNDITVFPNPFSNTLVISTGHNEETTISIIDIQSRTVYSETIIPENGRITLSAFDGLKAGVYFMQTKTGNRVLVHKLIKE